MPADAIAWAHDVLGPGARVIAQRFGEEADLWHFAAPHGDAWLKCHRHPPKAAHEGALLERLGRHLGDAIPEVIGARPPGALLLSACPGRPVELDALHPTARAAVLRDAGAFLRRLGELPRVQGDDADPVSLAKAYALRFRHWLARAEGHVPPDRLAQIASALDARVFAGVTRSVCHRDFRPANWIACDVPRRFSVIDFGQARLDDWVVDLAKLDPSDVQHVLAGFGRPLTPHEEARLAVLRALHELATLGWAASH